MTFAPSPLQAKAIQDIKDWFANRAQQQQVFRVFGYAGTGKTTITKHAIAELRLAEGASGGVLYGAFTGKAALVMSRKGTPASTIHSLIYRVSKATPAEIEKIKKEIADLKSNISAMGVTERLFAESQLRSLELRLSDIHKPRFVLNEQSTLRDAKLLVLDEVSMVGDDMARDLDAIVVRLRDTASSWVPQYFPNGRREGDEWRLANIKGDPPRKNGSCIIAVKGASLVGWSPEAPARRASPPPQAKKTKCSSPENTSREMDFILAAARPIAGTQAAEYLSARGLSFPRSNDLLFHPDLTHWEAKRGFPGMVAIVRDVHGERIGLHRTYLDPENPTKADVKPAKKTLGPVGGGAARLAEPRDGLIGLAEGIETALAAMTACPELPVFAALSAPGMENAVLPPEASRVIVLADHDEAGCKAAQKAAARFAEEGRRVFIAIPPKEGDDFNDLLVREGPPAVKAAIHAAVDMTPKAEGGALSWKAGLLRGREGQILPVLANAIHALRHAREWDGVLWHDEFATRTVARKPLPWMPPTSPWQDRNWSDRGNCPGWANGSREA